MLSEPRAVIYEQKIRCTSSSRSSKRMVPNTNSFGGIEHSEMTSVMMHDDRDPVRLQEGGGGGLIA